MCVVDDLHKKCRLCLSDGSNNLSIFDPQFSEGIPLSMKIMVCVSLTVTPGDSLPKRICMDCMTLVNQFYQFRETCMNTHMKLMQYLKNQDNSHVTSTSEVPEQEFKEEEEKTVTKDIAAPGGDQENVKDNYIPQLQFVSDSAKTVTVICQEFEQVIVSTDVQGDEVGNTEQMKQYDEEENLILPMSSSEDLCDLASLKNDEINSTDIILENHTDNLEEGCLVQLEKLSETTYALKPLSSRTEGSSNLTSLRRRYKCTGCIRVFSSLSSLDKHWDTCQQDQDTNVDEPEPDDGSLTNEKHNTNENDPEIKLEECAESQKSPPKYKRAKYGERRKYPCPTCGKVFKVPAMLHNHERVHTGERPFLCSLCTRSFTQMYALRNHEQQHRGESPYPCEECGKGFYRPSDLEKHMRSHTGERPFMCSVCSKAFHQLSGLVVHERIHTGERPYMCSFCPMKFNQWANKQRHEKTHAGGAKPYSCDTCHRKFSERKELELHRAGHSGGRPRSCQYCSKSFRKPSELKDHLRRMHTNERPYQCELCIKAFFAPHELKQHLMVHTGERPFTCSFCLRTFTQKGNLKRHHERHHKSELFDEEEATLIVEEVDMGDMQLTQLETTE